MSTSNKKNEEDIDKVVPEEKWEFGKEVSGSFDDMLRRSIPQYDVMRRCCTDIAIRNLKNDSVVIDMGCSRGEALVQVMESNPNRTYYIGIEISEPMLEQARMRFKEHIERGAVDVRKMDLTKSFPIEEADVIMAILCLQFTPIEYRQKILKNVYDHLKKNGIFIIVEKVIGRTAEIDDLLVTMYHELKEQNDYSKMDIMRKRLSLEGVLVPVTAEFNEMLLMNTGFQKYDCFWRYLNFAGWVAFK